MRRQLLAITLLCGSSFTLAALPVSPASAAPPNAGAANSSTGNALSAAGVSGTAVVQFAMKFLGYPYTAVGNSPSTGFSCIGFVSYVYRSLGINMPGDLGGAMAFAPPVAFSNLLPGDVLFFQNTVWTGLSHTAIYIGGGRFIHAEWYNRGVVISSFTNDPVDGNYWTAHYLGANRPWTGSTGAPSVAPPAQPRPTGTAVASMPPGNTAVAPSAPAPPVTTIQPHGGPVVMVRVPWLNVRSGPSLRAAVQTVVPRGTRVTILGHRDGWYQVSLVDGTAGWVIAAGIGRGSGYGHASRVAAPRAEVAARRVTLRRASGPARRLPVRVEVRAAVIVRVSGLRVHSAPGLASPVTAVAGLGERLSVLRRTVAWVNVRLPAGGTGWISSLYVTSPTSTRAVAAHATLRRLVSRASTRRQSRAPPATRARSVASVAPVAVNVRRIPSLTGAITTIVPPKETFRILGWSHGWARVRLPDGGNGWIDGSAIGRASTTRTPASVSTATTTARSTVTAGVRLRAGPGLSRPVIRLVAAGTRVQVLGSSLGWLRVRLPDRQTGYILGIYVRT